jgi:hypothetical protein
MTLIVSVDPESHPVATIRTMPKESCVMSLMAVIEQRQCRRERSETAKKSAVYLR